MGDSDFNGEMFSSQQAVKQRSCPTCSLVFVTWRHLNRFHRAEFALEPAYSIELPNNLFIAILMRHSSSHSMAVEKECKV